MKDCFFRLKKIRFLVLVTLGFYSPHIGWAQVLNINDTTFTSGTHVFTNCPAIVSPGDISNVEVSDTAAVTYLSKTKITLRPGFKAIGFSGNGKFVVRADETIGAVSVTATPSLIYIGESSSLVANGAESYLWSTGATTDTIAVSPAVTTTYTVTGNTTNSGCSITNTVTITVNEGIVWLGTISSDWFTSGNWGGGVPSSSYGVTIPSAAPNMPDISSAAGAECRSITIDSAATLTTSNAKNLDVYGDWVNNGTFIPNNGTVTFKGTGDQSLSGWAEDTLSFFSNLIVNKQGNLILNKEVWVENALTLTAGVVIVSETDGALVLADGATCSLGSDLAYVHGVFSKMGNDDFVFPLGDTALPSGPYHPLAITAPALQSDLYEARYYASAQTMGNAVLLQGNDLETISDCEHWLLIRSRGSSVVVPSLGWNVNSCDLDSVGNEELALAAWNGNDWTVLGNSGITENGNQGTITASQGVDLFYAPLVLGRFGSFSLSTIGLDPLPPELGNLQYKVYGVSGISGTYDVGDVVAFNHAQIPDTGCTVNLSLFGFPLDETLPAGSDSIKMVFDLDKFRNPSNLRLEQPAGVYTPVGEPYYYIDGHRLALLNGKTRYEEQLPRALDIMLEGGILMSPDNDSLYDNFTVVGNAPLQSYHILISDIHQNTLFESSDITESWDGKDAGNNLVPEGNYYYDIEFNGIPVKGQFLVEY